MIDPTTGIITQHGTDREVMREQMRQQFDQMEKFGQSRGSGYGGGSSVDPVGALIGVFLLLAIGCLLAFKLVTMLPPWALDLILVTLGIGAAIVVVKLTIWLVRSFIRRPVRTSIATAIVIAFLSYMGIQIRSAIASITASLPVPFTGKVSVGVSQSGRNGTILFQLFAKPNVWSSPVVIPAGVVHVQLRAVPKVKISINGAENPGSDYRPKPGDSLRFMAAGNYPAATTVRVFTHTPTNAELRSLIPLPVLQAKK